MNIEPGRINDDFFEKKKCQYAIPVLYEEEYICNYHIPKN